VVKISAGGNQSSNKLIMKNLKTIFTILTILTILTGMNAQDPCDRKIPESYVLNETDYTEPAKKQEKPVEKCKAKESRTIKQVVTTKKFAARIEVVSWNNEFGFAAGLIWEGAFSTSLNPMNYFQVRTIWFYSEDERNKEMARLEKKYNYCCYPIEDFETEIRFVKID